MTWGIFAAALVSGGVLAWAWYGLWERVSPPDSKVRRRGR